MGKISDFLFHTMRRFEIDSDDICTHKRCAQIAGPFASARFFLCVRETEFAEHIDRSFVPLRVAKAHPHARMFALSEVAHNHLEKGMLDEFPLNSTAHKKNQVAWRY
jgi:hypothetical protein